MKKYQNIDVSELVFSDIEYDLSGTDLDEYEGFSSIDELHDSLPKIVRIEVPEEDRKHILKAIKRNELCSLDETWDWFSDETGWCVCAATVSTKDGKYSETAE